jgi:hypothetical protein
MMMSPSLVPPRTVPGLFLVTLATIAYEILLTRIFSVTMWYHFAFVAISMAMFGMTVGALAVYLRPRFFPAEGVSQQLAVSSLALSVTMVLSFLLQLSWAFDFALSPAGVLRAAVFYAAVSVPFAFSGIAVCLALTRFPGRVPALYAADLLGAAAGCLIVIPLLRITDGPTAVVAVSALAAVAACAFAPGSARSGLGRRALVTALVLAGLAVAHTALVARQTPLVRLHWVKGYPEARPLYERWNSFSRITVFGDPAREIPPRGWGFSAAMPPTRVRQLSLLIDAGAGTPLTAFDGRRDALDHLKYDITNLPHYLRRGARVAVIGAGGGRDVLAALAFAQDSVVAIEVNGDIIDVVNRRFGDFTGHLDRLPGVRFVNDEGRSYLARQRDRFDIIQVSLIDTWAATAAGAFVLTENSLYTVDAWRTFLDRLTPSGVLAVSRFYMRDRPDEVYRLTSLARESLAAVGVTEPRRHIAIFREMPRVAGGPGPVGMATILVARSPLSETDLRTLDEVADRLAFDPVLTPRKAIDAAFEALASPDRARAFLAAFPVNVAAPTDDSPFFFHTLRLRDALRRPASRAEADNINMRAVTVLGALLIAVVGLTVICILLPLALTARAVDFRGSVPLFIFFAAIGLGFMLVEISQMQRLMLFLGHPTYGLSVVLFALLVSSGLGSLLVGAIRHGRLALVALLAVLVLFGALTPGLVAGWHAAVTPIRILLSIAVLLPIGLAMGTAFPLGMRVGVRRWEPLTPWLWGINGATSVCGSVLAVVIALACGISAAFWTGVACYVVATAAWLHAERRASADA